MDTPLQLYRVALGGWRGEGLDFLVNLGETRFDEIYRRFAEDDV